MEVCMALTRQVFNTPVVTPLLRSISACTLKLWGWRVVGETPSSTSKYVVIVGPHTSNWDFIVLLMAAFVLQLSDAHWLGKHTLFRFPFGGIMRWLGGIPVDRTAHHDMVAYVVEQIRASNAFVLGLSPEGTRRAVTTWHTGFWHIAQAANIPVYLAFIDFRTKECGIFGRMPSSGSVNEDMTWIKEFYSLFHGYNPENFTS